MNVEVHGKEIQPNPLPSFIHHFFGPPVGLLHTLHLYLLSSMPY